MILYATKYGSTREYAEFLARKLVCPAFEVGGPVPGSLDFTPKILDGSGFIVLGSPIYGPSVLPAMEGFIRSHRGILEDRKIAAFVVCGDTLWKPRAGEGGSRNLAKLTSLLPRPPFAEAVLGGRMRMEELDGTDRPAILAFYRRLGREPLGFNQMDLSAAVSFAEEVRRRLT